MRIGIISDTTYRACTPDYEHNLSYYGSEPAHAIIAKGFQDLTNWDVEWFAPIGSEPIGKKYHSLACYHGGYAENEVLEEISVERLNTRYFVDEKFDFVLDFTAIARTPEDLFNYYGFKNFGVFRNGYNGYYVPRLRIKDRNYIVPSDQNKDVFEKHGFTNTTTIYYGLPDFYCPGEDSNYINLFSSNGLELGKNYYLFPHRPTEEKGSMNVLELAKAFPQETFVFMVSNNPVAQHKSGTLDLKRKVAEKGLGNNVKFVELPLNNKHHYYKRELMRHAKAVLSPFNPHIYMEGFGLANAEAVACGTPVLITDSPSSRELWIDEKDGLVIPYEDRLWGFKQSIRNFSTYTFSPENKFTVQDCINNYLTFINNVIDKNNKE